jgi:N-acyl homoserine lactone hydrolase
MIKPSDVRRVSLGYYTMPATSRWPGEKVVVCGYLVRHADGVLLFDTGIGVGHAETEQEFGPIHRHPLAGALARLGLQASDVTTVANCHLHLDHCGNNPLFRGIPIFVQKNELEAVPSLDYVIPALIDFDGAALEIHDGHADIAAGLRIVPTPGHTPGHQSLLIETSRGRILLAGQAVDFASDYARVQFGLDVAAANPAEAVPSPAGWWAELRELDIRRVLFAHDLLAWDREPEADRPELVLG